MRYPIKKWSKKAYKLLEDGRFDEASDCFLFLTTLYPKDSLLWLGLGIAEQQLSRFEEALSAYEMAAACDFDAPLPYYYMAKCCFSLHDRPAALKAIDMTLEMCEEGSDLFKKSKEFKAQLKKF